MQLNEVTNLLRDTLIAATKDSEVEVRESVVSTRRYIGVSFPDVDKYYVIQIDGDANDHDACIAKGICTCN
jgi:hypothetical protein